MNFRKARLEDVETIHQLIGSHARKGELLPRSRNYLYDHLRDFWVAEDGASVVACGALHVSWSDLAELKSVVVRDKYQRHDVGSKIVQLCLDDARALGVKKIFALTLPDRVPFFEKHGFEQITRDRLPHKIWSECIHCIHFPKCNEVAVMKVLEQE